MSTTSTTGAFCADEGARVDGAPGDEAVDRRDDDGVGELDAQLVEAGLRLLALRAREVELRHARPDSAPRCRRASASAAAAAANRLRERSALVWASCRSASRWRMVAATLPAPLPPASPARRSSKSSILAMRWPRVTRSPSRTETSCSRPAARGATATVASPIRLPTTVSCCDHRAARALASSTVIGGRSPAAAPLKPPPPPATAAAAAGLRPPPRRPAPAAGSRRAAVPDPSRRSASAAERRTTHDHEQSFS